VERVESEQIMNYSQINLAMRIAMKREDPIIRSARKRTAEGFRRARKESPALARLIWKRMRDAEKQLIARYVNSSQEHWNQEHVGALYETLP